MNPEWVIRPYRPDDRKALFRIAGDTAFFGNPIEAYVEDRKLFLDAFYGYYTDYEPEQAWVAVADDHVIGFLVGSIDPKKHRRTMMLKVTPKLIMRLVRGEYRIGPKSRRYLREVVLAFARREIPGADETIYPAHLHVNVDIHWRGYGIGKGLLMTYLGHLRRLGVPGVHLQTTNLNRAACHVYESLGFSLLEARKTRMWEWIINEKVENRCYGLRL
ncbi:GNAT family N-acetyltransferase [Thermanaerothrix sp.]|jgi:ribosomal protein S18 acetylase RimI-like enzyme|uniref:GNAT family N-acetyltransferase n=1 Tax=Thermanaerothrix sp. TaxID=2972675 RepID=UPI002ADE1F35|nr:GNAT family N-acetyltransferase [Thermanaerothrix sp.]